MRLTLTRLSIHWAAAETRYRSYENFTGTRYLRFCWKERSRARGEPASGATGPKGEQWGDLGGRNDVKASRLRLIVKHALEAPQRSELWRKFDTRSAYHENEILSQRANEFMGYWIIPCFASTSDLSERGRAPRVSWHSDAQRRFFDSTRGVYPGIFPTGWKRFYRTAFYGSFFIEKHFPSRLLGSNFIPRYRSTVVNLLLEGNLWENFSFVRDMRKFLQFLDQLSLLTTFEPCNIFREKYFL